MSAQPQSHVTPEAYLAFERDSDTRHEYYAGIIVAMAGGTARHNRIAGSAYVSLYNQLRGRDCNVYPSDMRVKAMYTNMYSYPDVTVTCGDEQFEDSREDSLLNPVVIIEVLSPSTEKVDRGKKFQSYRTIPSLREYILIAQDEYHIERFVRYGENTWLLSEAIGQDTFIELSAIQCVLRLEEVYERVVFPVSQEDNADNEDE